MINYCCILSKEQFAIYFKWCPALLVFFAQKNQVVIDEWNGKCSYLQRERVRFVYGEKLAQFLNAAAGTKQYVVHQHLSTHRSCNWGWRPWGVCPWCQHVAIEVSAPPAGSGRLPSNIPPRLQRVLEEKKSAFVLKMQTEKWNKLNT